MTEEAKKVMYNFVDAISSQDADKIEACFTEDCVYEDIALGAVMHGGEAVKAEYKDLFIIVPDFKVEITLLFVAGNWVGCEWVMTGTSNKGKGFTTRGASISEFENGKFKRHTDYYDPTSFQQSIH
jgi:steroid delta-isomerase-like uncharacterized protein